jgi:hypothetical protein
MKNPNRLAELRDKLISLAVEWRSISEHYDVNDDQQSRYAHSIVVAEARQVFLSFGPLAVEIIEALGRERFPDSIPDPPKFVFNRLDLQQSAFAKKDPIRAGQLAILWAAATQTEWQLGVRRNFRVLVEQWVVSLAYSVSGGVTENGEFTQTSFHWRCAHSISWSRRKPRPIRLRHSRLRWRTSKRVPDCRTCISSTGRSCRRCSTLMQCPRRN